LKRIVAVTVFAVTVCLVACSPRAPKKPSTAPTGPSKTLLRYKFAPGKIIKYRFDEEVLGKLNVSSIPNVRSTKASSSMVVSERVARKLGDYADIERKIKSLQLKVWYNDKLTFDSTKWRAFSKRPELAGIRDLRKKIIKFEMNELGKIRNIRGLGSINFGGRPLESSQIIHTGNPLLPQGEVKPGSVWKQKWAVPFETDRKFRGDFQVVETTTLTRLNREKGQLIAMLDIKRKLTILLYHPSSRKRVKGFSGEGEAEGVFRFDVKGGKVLEGKMRTKLRVSTRIESTRKKIETSMDLNSTSRYLLLK